VTTNHRLRLHALLRSSTRYAQHIDLREKFVARMLKMRDYTLAYIRTHSNIADQFTKIVDPVSF
jgi:hypothetical protein